MGWNLNSAVSVLKTKFFLEYQSKDSISNRCILLPLIIEYFHCFPTCQLRHDYKGQCHTSRNHWDLKGLEAKRWKALIQSDWFGKFSLTRKLRRMCATAVPCFGNKWVIGLYVELSRNFQQNSGSGLQVICCALDYILKSWRQHCSRSGLQSGTTRECSPPGPSLLLYIPCPFSVHLHSLIHTVICK